MDPAAASRLSAGVLRRRDDVDDGTSTSSTSEAQAARWAGVPGRQPRAAGSAAEGRIGEATGRAGRNAGKPAGEDRRRRRVDRRGAAAPASEERRWRDARRRLSRSGDPQRQARFSRRLRALDATLLLVPAQSRDLPEDDIERLARRMQRHPFRFEARSMTSLLDMVDTVLLARATTRCRSFARSASRRARRRTRAATWWISTSCSSPARSGLDRLVHEPFRGRRKSALPGGRGTADVDRTLEAALLFAAGQIAAGAGGRGRRPPYRSGLGASAAASAASLRDRPDRVTPGSCSRRAPADARVPLLRTRTSARFSASKVEGRSTERLGVRGPHPRREPGPLRVARGSPRGGLRSSAARAGPEGRGARHDAPASAGRRA